jgi:ornithine cyclodeaminase/alanine dehydrogenase-like protein (mu-crystallin family)
MLDEIEGRIWVAHHEALNHLLGRAGRRAAETLILTRRDVCRLMDAAAWLDAAEAGFRAAADGRASAPPPMTIEAQDGAFHAKAARCTLGRHYVALKLNGNFPGNPQAWSLPTIQGAILLCDGDTGSILAILDSIEVTLRRTAAATALAARYLARPESETVLVCGCGEQGRAQLAALRAILPLKRVLAWDRDRRRAEAFAAETGATILDILPTSGSADVIVTCTTATTAFLGASHVGPGCFVAAVGADSPHKSEIEPGLMESALVVADVLEQCAVMGDLHHAFAAGLDRERVHAELAELVSGRKPGRTADDQIALFDSTGSALLDVAAAAMVYERAQNSWMRHRVALGRAA